MLQKIGMRDFVLVQNRSSWEQFNCGLLWLAMVDSDPVVIAWNCW